MSDKIDELVKRINFLEANQIEDFDLINQINDLKRCIWDMAEVIADLKQCSVAEIVNTGVLI